jgi:hypothetical protein
MLYSKNGSIPKPETDGTEGWIEVLDTPVAGEGQEVVWVYPPGWIVRDVMPPVREGYRWMHFLDRGWVEYPLPETVIEEQPLTSIDISALTSGDISALTTSQISAL